MRTGFSVFLLAVGAVLTFALHKHVSGIDLRTVGVILMVAGAIGLAITAAVYGPRRRDSLVHERTTTASPADPVDPTVTPYPTNSPGATNRVTSERVERHEVY